MKIAILGAGLTGCELGRRLREQSKDFVILEKEDRIGGLCRTFKTGPYAWDLGVHALYSRDQAVMDYFESLPLSYQRSQRNVRIFHTGPRNRKYLIDYPFENGIPDLPAKDKAECVWGYLKARMHFKSQFSNLEEWIRYCLGDGIAKHFMLPYNRKIWDCPLAEISTRLVSAKIEPDPVWKFLLTALGKKTVGRAYQARFIYPQAGIQALVDHTARDIRGQIHLNCSVEHMQKKEEEWEISCSNGEKVFADKIVSTIPLSDLIQKVSVPGLERQYQGLRWNNTCFVMIGLKPGSRIGQVPNCHWVFLKEQEVFYRVTLMHNFNADFPPTIVAEITAKDGVVTMPSAAIIQRVVDDLCQQGIILQEHEIQSTDIRLIDHTYAIPTVDSEKIKEQIKSALLPHQVHLLGRNGNWDYINMDGVIKKVDDFVRGRHL